MKILYMKNVINTRLTVHESFATKKEHNLFLLRGAETLLVSWFVAAVLQQPQHHLQIFLL
jgi:hypothetical protein